MFFKFSIETNAIELTDADLQFLVEQGMVQAKEELMKAREQAYYIVMSGQMDAAHAIESISQHALVYLKLSGGSPVQWFDSLRQDLKKRQYGWRKPAAQPSNNFNEELKGNFD